MPDLPRVEESLNELVDNVKSGELSVRNALNGLRRTTLFLFHQVAGDEEDALEWYRELQGMERSGNAPGSLEFETPSEDSPSTMRIAWRGDLKPCESSILHAFRLRKMGPFLADLLTEVGIASRIALRCRCGIGLDYPVDKQDRPSPIEWNWIDSQIWKAAGPEASPDRSVLWIPPSLDIESGEIILTALVPVDHNSQMEAVWSIDVPALHLIGDLPHQFEPDTVRYAVYDQNGIELATSTPHAQGEIDPSEFVPASAEDWIPVLSPEAVGKLLSSPSAQHLWRDSHGLEWVCVHRVLPAMQWLVVAGGCKPYMRLDSLTRVELALNQLKEMEQAIQTGGDLDDLHGPYELLTSLGQALVAHERIQHRSAECLYERNKELTCIFAVTQLVSRARTVPAVLEGVAGILPNAMQFPEHALAELEFDGAVYSSQPAPPNPTAEPKSAQARGTINVAGSERGHVAVRYLCPDGPDTSFLSFSLEEHDLITCVAQITSQAIARLMDEAAVRARELQHQAFVDVSELGTWEWHIPDNFVVFDEGWTRMLGYQQSELEPNFHSFTERVHPDDRQFVEDTARSFLQGENRKYEGQFRLRHKNGRWVWVQARGRIVERDSQGRPLRIIGTHIDITSIKDAEASADAAKRLFSYYVENVDGYVFIKDLEGRYIFLNRLSEQILGVSNDELKNKVITDRDLFSPEAVADIREADRLVVESGRGITFEETHRRPIFLKDTNQPVIHFQSIKFPLRSDSGEIVGICGFSRDVTTRYEAEIALRRSEAQYRTLVESLPHRVALRDTEGRFLSCNSAFAQDFQMSSADLVGKSLSEVLPPEEARLWLEKEQQILATGNRIETVYPYPQDNEQHWFHSTQIPVLDEADQTLGVLSVISDITSRRRLENELKWRQVIAETFLRAESWEPLFVNLCSVISQTLECDYVILGHLDDDSICYPSLQSKDIQSPDIGGRPLIIPIPKLPASSRTALTERRTVQARTQDHFLSAVEPGSHSLAVPVHFRDSMIGHLELFRQSDREEFHQEEIERAESIAAYLAPVLNSRLDHEYSERSRKRDHDQMLALLDAIDEIIYVADPDTYELVYTNSAFRKVFGKVHPQSSNKCYHVLQKLDAPCEFCTNPMIFGDNTGKPFVWEFHNQNTRRWYRCVDKAITWPDGRKLRFELASDITNLRQNELKLAHFRAAIDNSPDGIFIINTHTLVVEDANETALRSIGRSREELGRFALPDFVESHGPESMRKLVQHTGQNPPSRFVEAVHRHRDGTTFPVEVRIQVQADTEGRMMVANARDVTESRRQEESYRTVIQSMNEGFFVCDIRGRLLDFNSALVKLLGYSRVELESMSVQGFEVLRQPSDILEHLQETVVQQFDRLETKYARKDGTVLDVELSIAYREETEGRFFVFVHDVTERAQTADLLRQERKRLYDVLEFLPAFVSLLEHDRSIRYANHHFRDVFGWAEHTPIQPPDQAPSSNGGESSEMRREFDWSNPDNGRTYHIISYPFTDLDGARLQLEMGIDVQDRIETERDLKELNESLKQSNRELEQFAYVASHDLQEPLRMVANFTQLLQRKYQGRLDENAHRYIQFAVDGAVRMQNLIDDLLTYSRVGTRGRAWTTVDCNQVLKRVVAQLQLKIRETKATLESDPLPTVLGDATQLEQLFQNLISNALKFRRESISPHIVVRAESTATHVQVSVSDNGIGIEPDQFERIFAIFQRLHPQDKYDGTGIGLAICKKIVERHRGRIWLESSVNKGTTFHFTLMKP